MGTDVLAQHHAIISLPVRWFLLLKLAQLFRPPQIFLIWLRSKGFHHRHNKRSSLRSWPVNSSSVPFFFLCVSVCKPSLDRESCCWFLWGNLGNIYITKTFQIASGLLQNLFRTVSNTFKTSSGWLVWWQIYTKGLNLQSQLEKQWHMILYFYFWFIFVCFSAA